MAAELEELEAAAAKQRAAEAEAVASQHESKAKEEEAEVVSKKDTSDAANIALAPSKEGHADTETTATVPDRKRRGSRGSMAAEVPEHADATERERAPKRAKADEAPDDADDLQVEQDLLGESVESIRTRTSTPADEERPTRASATTTYSGRQRLSRMRASREEAVSATPSPPTSPPARATRSQQKNVQETTEDENSTASDVERDKSRKRMAQLLLLLHNQVSNHTHANLFHQAIKEVDAPDYYTLIKQPMDLKIIKQRIKEGTIASSLDLRWALSLMFANALMYNNPGTEVHRMANEMRMATEEILDEFDRTPLGT